MCARCASVCMCVSHLQGNILVRSEKTKRACLFFLISAFLVTFLITFLVTIVLVLVIILLIILSLRTREDADGFLPSV